MVRIHPQKTQRQMWRQRHRNMEPQEDSQKNWVAQEDKKHKKTETHRGTERERHKETSKRRWKHRQDRSTRQTQVHWRLGTRRQAQEEGGTRSLEAQEDRQKKTGTRRQTQEDRHKKIDTSRQAQEGGTRAQAQENKLKKTGTRRGRHKKTGTKRQAQEDRPKKTGPRINRHKKREAQEDRHKEWGTNNPISVLARSSKSPQVLRW